MKRTALLASIALTAGLAAPAFAQEIAGTTVSAEDWPAVEEYCDTLADLNTADAADNEPTTPAELSTSSIQLDGLTRDDCVEAGLIDGAPEAGNTMESPDGNDDMGSDDDAQ